MIFQPANFRCSVTRQYRIADLGDAAFNAAKIIGYLFALGHCRGIAPQLYWRQHITVCGQWHKAVLLAGNGDCGHFGFVFADKTR